MVSTDSDQPEDNILGQLEGDWVNQHSLSVINLMIDTVFNFGMSKSKDDIGCVG